MRTMFLAATILLGAGAAIAQQPPMSPTTLPPGEGAPVNPTQPRQGEMPGMTPDPSAPTPSNPMTNPSVNPGMNPGMTPGQQRPGASVATPTPGQPGMNQPSMNQRGMGQPGMNQQGMNQQGMGQQQMGQPGTSQGGMDQRRPGMGGPASNGDYPVCSRNQRDNCRQPDGRKVPAPR